MNYIPYQHIEKLGTAGTEGILSGNVYLSYKIDGTNATVWLKDDGELGFGSRRRELTLIDDNAGFMSAMSGLPAYAPMFQDLKKYLTAHPDRTIYGEWLTKHTLTRYKIDAWNKFYIFDVKDNPTDSYVNYDDYSKEFASEEPNLLCIPLIAVLTNPTADDVRACLPKTGDWLISEGLGEGIVLKNYGYRNRYGRQTWAKVLTEDFRQTKAHHRHDNTDLKEEHATEYGIIKLMTTEHVKKEYFKVLERHETADWKPQFTFELLNRAFEEFIGDNWEIILKKFHLPTVDFKVLKSLSDAFVKETIETI